MKYFIMIFVFVSICFTACCSSELYDSKNVDVREGASKVLMERAKQGWLENNEGRERKPFVVEEDEKALKLFYMDKNPIHCTPVKRLDIMYIK